MRHLVGTRSDATREKVRGLYHGDKPRPFLSPDGKMVLFHSNVDGPCQIFAVTGFAFPEE